MALRRKELEEMLTWQKVSAAVMAAATAIAGFGPQLVESWNAIPDDWKHDLPHGWAHWIATAGFLLVTLSHFIAKGERDAG
ncbi:hypothetical protein [Paraburkholderia sp. J8-2]|uniref:DUF7940 domain-containing protein n=1 Tax=Paraburkholderia sp. J8-2 TaxID=2805440 RepID=UPI002AB5F845|nr:hypothetical protein [Paraburkholderia sp. J8-2]